MAYYTNWTFRCQCNKCGIKGMNFLTIEHSNNDGADHRRKIGSGSTTLYKWLIRNNFPIGYTVLCFNCNSSRGFFGSCH